VHRYQEAAAELGTAPPPDADAALRADLTGHRVLTIDDASTTEIDDGLSVEQLHNGSWRLWVHIADPSRWVDFGDALDAEAARRSKSAYLPTGEHSPDCQAGDAWLSGRLNGC
jgi:exoribonuclease II